MKDLDTQLLQNRWQMVITHSPLPLTRKELLKQKTAIANLDKTSAGVIVSDPYLLNIARRAIQMREEYFLKALSAALDKEVTKIEIRRGEPA
jgi:hypothetical protein